MKPGFKSVIAVTGGLLLTVVLSVVTDAILEKTGAMKTDPFDANPIWLISFIICYRTLYSVAGCYLAAFLAPSKPVRHALILGIIELSLTALGAAAMWDVPPHWYPIMLGILTLPAAYLGGFLAARNSRVVRVGVE